MQELDDIALLREYVEHGSEEAFATLVTRHVNKVYSVALRLTRNPHQAEEITQAVFVILAKKSRHLSGRVVLSGWLYQTARLTAMTFIRSEIRRARREQEACMQTELNEADSALWTQIAPLLDTAMAALNETDRQAVVLRFFDGKSMREIGAVLGANEAAAERRVSRALGKLQKFFFKRGVASTTANIAETISAHSVQVAPAMLAKSATAVALAKGAAASTSTLTLIKGALKVMAWTKAKTALVAGVVVLLAAGTTSVTVQEIRTHTTYPWQVQNANSDVLQKVPPQVRIAPAKYPESMGCGIVWASDGRSPVSKVLGIGQPLEGIVSSAYGQSEERMVFLTKVPTGKFDFIANLPSGNEAALRKEIQRKFGMIGKRETRDTDVLLLTVRTPGADGLKAADKSRLNPNEGSGSFSLRAGNFRCRNQPLSTLGNSLEGRFKVPVVDRTGLANRYDIDLSWDETDYQHPNTNALSRALTEQLGLELVSTNMPVEMLVVEKGK